MKFIFNLVILMQEAFYQEANELYHDDLMESRASHDEPTFDVEKAVNYYWHLPVALFKAEVFQSESNSIENIWLQYKRWDSIEESKEVQ